MVAIVTSFFWGRCQVTDVHENNSGQGECYPVPADVAGWSWGGFCLNWIWAIGNRTWLGLFAMIPIVGIVVDIILGVKGRTWAWQNKRWDSIEHFNRVQRRWSIWGICLRAPWLIAVMAGVISYNAGMPTNSLPIKSYFYAERAASHIGAYIVVNHRLPASLKAGGALQEPLPDGIRSMVLNQQTAQLEITLDETVAAGKTFYLAPGVNDDGYVAWRCLHGDVPQRLLPKPCRFSSAEPLRLPR
jgi:hypothetical protein